jgi:hypothetical protein
MLKRLMAPGISIATWGPSAWNFLHAVAYSYKDNPSDADKEAMYMFIVSFSKVIPCKICRDEFTEYIEKNVTRDSKIFDSKKNMIEFMHITHNNVNKRLGKPLVSMEKSNYMYLYEYDTTKFYIKAIVVIITVLIFLQLNKKICVKLK